MIIRTCALFCISFALVIPSACQRKTDKRYERPARSLSTHIGEKFQLDNILDSTGKTALLDLSQSEVTIIDLWFNTCPPCIAEMTQFAQLLPGKEKKISVISISINNFSLWKKTLDEHSGRFSFLGTGFPNWKHYMLQSKQDEKLKNQISADRLEELREKYDVQFFPAYFVLDKNGIIQSRLSSAVKFIREYN